MFRKNILLFFALILLTVSIVSAQEGSVGGRPPKPELLFDLNRLREVTLPDIFPPVQKEAWEAFMRGEAYDKETLDSAYITLINYEIKLTEDQKKLDKVLDSANSDYFTEKEKMIASLIFNRKKDGDELTNEEIAREMGFSAPNARYYRVSIEGRLAILDIIKEKEAESLALVERAYVIDGKITKEEYDALKLYLTWKNGNYVNYLSIGRELAKSYPKYTTYSKENDLYYAVRTLLSGACDKACDSSDLRWSDKEHLLKMVMNFKGRFTDNEIKVVKSHLVDEVLLSQIAEISENEKLNAKQIYADAKIKAQQLLDILKEERGSVELLKKYLSPDSHLLTESEKAIIADAINLWNNGDQKLRRGKVGKIINKVKAFHESNSALLLSPSPLDSFFEKEGVKLGLEKALKDRPGVFTLPEEGELGAYIRGGGYNKSVLRQAYITLAIDDFELEKEAMALRLVNNEEYSKYFTPQMKKIAQTYYSRLEDGGKRALSESLGNNMTLWYHFYGLEGRVATLPDILKKEQEANMLIDKMVEAGHVNVGSKEERALRLFASWKDGKPMTRKDIGKELDKPWLGEGALIAYVRETLNNACKSPICDLKLIRPHSDGGYNENILREVLLMENPELFLTEGEIRTSRARLFSDGQFKRSDRSFYDTALRRAEKVPALLKEKEELNELILKTYASTLPEGSDDRRFIELFFDPKNRDNQFSATAQGMGWRDYYGDLDVKKVSKKYNDVFLKINELAEITKVVGDDMKRKEKALKARQAYIRAEERAIGGRVGPALELSLSESTGLENDFKLYASTLPEGSDDRRFIELFFDPKNRDNQFSATAQGMGWYQKGEIPDIDRVSSAFADIYSNMRESQVLTGLQDEAIEELPFRFRQPISNISAFKYLKGERGKKLLDPPELLNLEELLEPDEPDYVGYTAEVELPIPEEPFNSIEYIKAQRELNDIVSKANLASRILARKMGDIELSYTITPDGDLTLSGITSVPDSARASYEALQKLIKQGTELAGGVGEFGAWLQSRSGTPLETPVTAGGMPAVSGGGFRIAVPGVAGSFAGGQATKKVEAPLLEFFIKKALLGP